VVIDLYWWIDISTDASKSFEQAKQEYFARFPEFIGEGHGVTMLNLVLLSVSGFLFIKASAAKQLKVVSAIGTIICLILGAWMIFSLM
jgi:hypothetical protein